MNKSVFLPLISFQFPYSAVKTEFRQECYEGKTHKPCPRNVNFIR